MSSDGQNVPTFMGIPMKVVSLVTLTFQNSALILIMHYSRVMPTTSRYFASTAVFLNEVLKLVICVVVALRDRQKHDGEATTLATSIRFLVRDIFGEDSWKLAIPAALYTLQNNLQYVAVSNLDAATFQVTYQLKILTTALFSVTMLGRRLSNLKWFSLVMLTVGVAVVQLPSAAPPQVQEEPSIKERVMRNIKNMLPGAGNSSVEVPDNAPADMNRMVGLSAVIVACMISGLAGVYFEKVLKRSSTSLWLRNVQLSFFSLFPAFFLGVLVKDGREIAQRGFFDGYNMVVWTAILFQAGGGIVVALCVNYADNIAKNFATSISILVSCIASVYFFDFVVSMKFVVGAALVLYATFLYSKPDPVPPPVKYVPLEKTVTDSSDSSDSPNSDEKAARRLD